MLDENDSQLALERTGGDLQAALKSAGHKLTPARLAIVRVLDGDGRHLSPAEVLNEARRFHPSLSRATVYRTLDLLTDMGLLRPLYLGERGTRVARIAGGHEHLVCVQCGAVTHLDSYIGETLERALVQQIQETSCDVQGFLLEVYWTCSACSSRQADRG